LDECTLHLADVLDGDAHPIGELDPDGHQDADREGQLSGPFGTEEDELAAAHLRRRRNGDVSGSRVTGDGEGGDRKAEKASRCEAPRCHAGRLYHRENGDRLCLARMSDTVSVERARLEELERKETELSNAKNDFQLQSRALAQANVNSARLIAEIEEKNEQLEKVLRALEEAKSRLENSFDEVKKQAALQEIANRRMEAELETARAVQSMLIPDQVRPLEGLEVALSYRSASECGGDWLGCFEDPETGQLAVLIGDVTGHGVGSALMTAGVFSYFSTLRTLRDSSAILSGRQDPLNEPVSILQNLDRVISHMGKNRTFMTLFASIIDYKRKSVRYSNAGHCFPLIMSRKTWESHKTKDRRRAELLSMPGKILGYASSPTDVSFQSREIDLEAEDVLFWYTDGLIENRNKEGVAIGERRMHEWIFDLWEQPIEDIKRGVESRVAEFLGEHPLDDDIAFIVARIK
jgi:serine phosphatase RsbU (regulator of sigma subunit)